ncbi:hypothetical protein CDL12_15143 [Handroanthus impetiginosus]|uniref:Uncharacterized protein n=1 Tax=Handroanthus impetiginosus TaxID=429701 RepID=A0A2G9H408_9LAMI|nr:hypothetical protein CDL12_15143 [Handroanthus impetiginosus]
MVCLGILFGCRPETVESYALSALIIIAILVCLRLFCYFLRLLLRKVRNSNQENEAREYEFRAHQQLPEQSVVVAFQER